MIKFEHIEKLLKDGGFTHCRIADSHNNRLFDLKANSPGQLYELIKDYAATFSNYDKVIIKAGGENDVKNHFANATRWIVNFASVQSNMTVTPLENSKVPISASMEILGLHKEVTEMKLKMEYEAKERELEKKYKDKGGDDWMKYFPMAGLFMDIPEARLNKALQMYQLSGLMNGNIKPAALSGPANATPDKINEELDLITMKISENPQIDPNDLLVVLKEINARPELLKKAVNAIKLKML